MKKIAVLMLSLVLVAASAVQGQSNNVQAYCNMVTPDQVRVFDWSTWQTTYVNDPNLAVAPFQWDASQTIWRGYDSATPFDQPSDTFKHWSVTLIQADGSEQWIYLLDSPQTPNVNYVYVFDNVQAFADNQGDHYGIHPCRAFATDTNLVSSWLDMANQSS
jgi:hypothetical protein